LRHCFHIPGCSSAALASPGPDHRPPGGIGTADETVGGGGRSRWVTHSSALRRTVTWAEIYSNNSTNQPPRAAGLEGVGSPCQSKARAPPSSPF
jgi:hypothetical protein